MTEAETVSKKTNKWQQILERMLNVIMNREMQIKTTMLPHAH